jgi:hypothetical protein
MLFVSGSQKTMANGVTCPPLFDNFGKTGVKISALGLGGHHLGGAKDEKTAIEILHRVLTGRTVMTLALYLLTNGYRVGEGTVNSLGGIQCSIKNESLEGSHGRPRRSRITNKRLKKGSMNERTYFAS